MSRARRVVRARPVCGVRPGHRLPVLSRTRPAQCLPGVTVEAASPDLIEKVRTATTDADGQYRIAATARRHLQRDVLAARLQHRAPRRHPARWHVRRDDQRRDESRRDSGDGRRHRRIAAGRRPERQPADDTQQRHHQRDSGRPVVRGPDVPDAEHGDPGWRGREFAGPQHGGLRRGRWPCERRAPAGGRHQRRHRLQRRRRLRLRRRREQRPGNRPHRLGRPGRGGSRRPDAQHSAEGGRQPVLPDRCIGRWSRRAWSAATTPRI